MARRGRRAPRAEGRLVRAVGPLLCLAVVGSLGCGGPPAPSPESLPPEAAADAGRPVNLLVVTADTTRVDALAPWGADAPTPHLGRLARESVVFEDAHSVAFGTTPSHASLFTGLPASRHGVYNNQTALAPERETLIERLRDSGYETAAFVGSAAVARPLGLDQGFLLFDDAFTADGGNGVGEGERFERRADVTVDRFAEWLEGRGGAAPLAAWLHFYDPHQPYAPPAPVEGEPPEIGRLFGPPDDPRYLKAESIPGDLAELVDRAARRRYEAEIAFMDAQIGRAISLLQRRALAGQTVVLFVTDHGENFLDRGSSLAWGHAGLLPEVTRIGVLLRLPRGELAGRRVRGAVANSELACLVARALEIEPGEAWSCRGLLATLRAGGQLPPRDLVMEGAWRGEVAIRTERWLFRQAGVEIPEEELPLDGFNPGARLQLYDLLADPGSRHDLIAAGKSPPEVQARLEGLANAVRLARLRAEGRPLTDGQRQALRALGYLH